MPNILYTPSVLKNRRHLFWDGPNKMNKYTQNHTRPRSRHQGFQIFSACTLRRPTAIGCRHSAARNGRRRSSAGRNRRLANAQDSVLATQQPRPSAADVALDGDNCAATVDFWPRSRPLDVNEALPGPFFPAQQPPHLCRAAGRLSSSRIVGVRPISYKVKKDEMNANNREKTCMVTLFQEGGCSGSSAHSDRRRRKTTSVNVAPG